MLNRRFLYGAVVVAGGLFAGTALAAGDNGYGAAASTGQTMNPTTRDQTMGQTTQGQSTMGETGQEQMGQSQTNQRPSFAQIDTNGDGYISKSEWKQSGAFQMDSSRLDTNNDGRINRSEFAAFEQAHQSRPSNSSYGNGSNSSYGGGNSGYGNSGHSSSGARSGTYQEGSATDHMPQ